ncbi:MAG TPA: acyl-CoA dehydrogenase family protein [Solirubrobacteraceae bacterium]|nr:acyl-CoA dehydrogenase family protein [Solirubrobacteraceae bacterium]
MERPWPDEALDFEAAVVGALSRLGGIELARRCEARPELRDVELSGALSELGLFDLDVHGSAVMAAAAARAMLAAGSVACPWPLVQQLSVPAAIRDRVQRVYLCDREPGRAEHLDLGGRSVALDVVSGEFRELVAFSGIVRAPLDPFGVPCELGPVVDDEPNGSLGVHVVLAAFWVVGALGRARDLTVEYAKERRQFGTRIADFGAIQWHLSDLAVAHDSLWELASFSLGRLIDGRLQLADTLALQLTTAESAQAVMSHAHQVLGAIGLCEEHDVTLLDRHVQALVRRPCGTSRTLGLLVDEISRSGFDSLYPVAATAAA